MDPFFLDVAKNLSAELAAIGIAAGVGSLLWYLKRQQNLWLGLGQSNSNGFLRKCKTDAKDHFDCTWWPKVHVAMDVEFLEETTGAIDGETWKSFLQRCMEVLRQIENRKLSGRSIRLHLVLGTYSLWSMAFGMLLKNRHPLVLYHYQVDSTAKHIHQVWEVDRSIKNLQAPRHGQEFVMIYFQSLAVESPIVPLADGDKVHECLVIEGGSRRISESVREFRQSRLPKSSLRILTRTQDLKPDEPKMWLHAAAEVSHALSDRSTSAATETYLFWDGPAVLALMVGDTIGDYIHRKIILMQWDKVRRTYVAALTLPDANLSSAAG